MEALNKIYQDLGQTLFHPLTFNSLTIYITYYTYICLGSILLPAKIINGHPNPKRGPRLQYSVNGFTLTCMTIVLMLLFGGVIPGFSSLKLVRLSIFVDEFWALWSTVNVFAVTASAFLYVKGFMGKSYLGEYVDHHSHGSFLMDLWLGRELNPRIGSFDLKFVAYRVAMIFWLILNFAFLAKQFEISGTCTYRMIFYQITTGIYILDYFWNEEKILTTWDIISEEFGHMLVFGDYVFIPFVFSIQAHYLLDYPDFDSVLPMIFIFVLYVIGYYIFRVGNSQKNQYKTEPNKTIWGKKPQTIGGKLLVSGFWGIGRHINYTGDIIMSFAYCLPCGTQFPAYTYSIYLIILLTHRAYRDDAKCKLKYHKFWQEYCIQVPYVFVPFKPIDTIFTTLGQLLFKLTNEEKDPKID